MSQSALAVGHGRRSSRTAVILSHPALGAEAPSQSVLARARLMHRNQSCPRCGRVTVEPVEYDDALLDRNGTPIPGSASVAGFSCNSCHGEWGPSRIKLAVIAD